MISHQNCLKLKMVLVALIFETFLRERFWWGSRPNWFTNWQESEISLSKWCFKIFGMTNMSRLKQSLTKYYQFLFSQQLVVFGDTLYFSYFWSTRKLAGFASQAPPLGNNKCRKDTCPLEKSCASSNFFIYFPISSGMAKSCHFKIWGRDISFTSHKAESEGNKNSLWVMKGTIIFLHERLSSHFDC